MLIKVFVPAGKAQKTWLEIRKQHTGTEPAFDLEGGKMVL
jgi:hypothetical protein